jgi:hypothetical protein
MHEALNIHPRQRTRTATEQPLISPPTPTQIRRYDLVIRGVGARTAERAIGADLYSMPGSPCPTAGSGLFEPGRGDDAIEQVAKAIELVVVEMGTLTPRADPRRQAARASRDHRELTLQPA